MLEELLRKLSEGPFETDVLIHSVNVQMVSRMLIYSADAVGIVAQKKNTGILSTPGWGPRNGCPWSAVSLIRFGDA